MGRLTRLPGTPLNDCHTIIKLSCWLAAFSLCLNSTLFLLRIFGVFYESRIIKIVFATLWLSTFTAFIAPSAAYGHHLGPTKQCIAKGLSLGDALGYLVVAAFDTIVFLAITVKVLADNSDGSWKAQTKLLFNSKQMGKIYRTLLRTGQLYYLYVTCTTSFSEKC